MLYQRYFSFSSTSWWIFRRGKEVNCFRKHIFTTVDINGKIDGPIPAQTLKETSFVTAKAHPFASSASSTKTFTPLNQETERQQSDCQLQQKSIPGKLFIKQDRSRRFGRSMTMTSATTIEPQSTPRLLRTSIEALTPANKAVASSRISMTTENILSAPEATTKRCQEQTDSKERCKHTLKSGKNTLAYF